MSSVRFCKGTKGIPEETELFPRYPFEVIPDNKALQNGNSPLLISRFLIEDNSRPEVDFSILAEKDMNEVEVQFFKLIKEYALFTPEEEQKLGKELGDVFSFETLAENEFLDHQN